MKRILCIIAALFILSLSGMARATTFEWNLGDLYDLDHNYYYTWGEDDWTIPAGETIRSASVTFHDIRNNDWSSNDLYLHLLDRAVDGVRTGWDGSRDGSYFAYSSLTMSERRDWDGLKDGSNSSKEGYSGIQIALEHWENLPPIAQDITYAFDASEIDTLIAYLENDGVFGLGFDPDCHFYNSGISFNVGTSSAPVPEPATMLLLGCGLAGVGLIRRKKG